MLLGLCLSLSLSLSFSLLGCHPRYQVPRPERPMVVPDDHPLHPSFKTEWWYWNGHLASPAGEQFDFFLSFTRHDTRGDRFLGIPIITIQPDSHIGMFALVDRRGNRCDVSAKSNFPDFWAAGGDTQRMWLFHDSWTAQWAEGAFHLIARTPERELHLRLRPQKPAALYGQRGYVHTAGIPHYVYSYTRMQVDGALIEDGRSTRLEGIGWFDHFLGHVAQKQVKAWDWMSIQLDDGYEYMIAQLRDDDGKTTNYANFEVRPDGSVGALAAGEPRWHLKRVWKSPASDNTYRVAWTIEAADLELEVEPVLDAQEFRAPPVSRFWEGATRIKGTHLGKPVKGEGYLETVAEGGLPVGVLRFSK